MTAALQAAEEAGEPFVVLEGAPGPYTTRWGFEPAADHGLVPPSCGVLAAARRLRTLRPWDPATAGALVDDDVVWAHDAVGLRGETLAHVRATSPSRTTGPTPADA